MLHSKLTKFGLLGLFCVYVCMYIYNSILREIFFIRMNVMKIVNVPILLVVKFEHIFLHISPRYIHKLYIFENN